MKTRCLLAMVVLAGCGLRGEVPKDKIHFVPATFASRAAAESYVKLLFAGGNVTTLSVGKKEVLVVSVYGSGVPEIAIAAYKFVDRKWVFAAEFRPGGEHCKAEVQDGAVVAVGTRTGKKTVLIEAEEQEAN